MVSRQLRLPREKILRLKGMLSSCIQKRSLTKRELQSLVGLLQFAAKVICPGRPFLRRLFAMQQIGSSPSYHICLNAPARADMLWWHLFMDRWNGISILWDLQRQATASFSCVGIMGLWCLWSSSLALPEMECMTPTTPHSNQGTNSNHFSSSLMG